jgi:hypothetical protein
MDSEQAKFEGWALIELFGHAREAGYVTTVYFGSAAMFRVDVPEIPARQETADRPRWINNKLCPVGTIVEAEAIPGRTRYIGPSAVYAMNPASEEAARAAASKMVERDITIIHMPASAQLNSGDVLPGESDDEEIEDSEYENIPGR